MSEELKRRYAGEKVSDAANQIIELSDMVAEGHVSSEELRKVRGRIRAALVVAEEKLAEAEELEEESA